MGSSVCLTLCNAGHRGITPVQDWQSCVQIRLINPRVTAVRGLAARGNLDGPVLGIFRTRRVGGQTIRVRQLRTSPSLPPPCPSSSLPSLQTFVAEPPPPSPCHVVG
ncbi:hypothetical protein Vretifemale_9478 [Volvox reticuliferus]|uniref:Uncharacterized protein n=1 Tax=Volvox reticuliferus TaxID=1737510 RepID=A0A8J4CIJ7_9CHLO|nr:hypothetical protein Vretifemale_9478 [Volvox reticuliferus]